MTLVIPLAERKIVRQTTRISLAVALALIFISTFTLFSYGQTAQTLLTRHVPQVVVNGKAQLLGQLPASQIMRFDIVIPLRDQPGLDLFLQDLYNPASPFYHLFITPPEFTERFGPSQEDWDALVAFAKASGFQIFSGTRDERDLRVTATVAAIERAFHVSMGIYQHPIEDRVFYSLDREPTVNLPFPLMHVSGLDNYSIPRSMRKSRYDYAKAHGIDPDAIANATTGSGPSASFLGSDMRAAYYCNGTCGTGTLTGSGQNVALFEYEGTDLVDLGDYYTNVGQTLPFTPTLISTDGTSTSCTWASGKCDDGEQTLDMTQALGMAPGMKMLYMYVGNTDTAIISAMVATVDAPLSMQIGCSWGWTDTNKSTDETYWQQMATQGQNFFAASGDDATWCSSSSSRCYPFPADDPYVVAVGGTDLTTSSAAGPWNSETGWASSGGGIDPLHFAIPSWQQISGVINSSNKGSTTYRNGPDISANANYTFYTCDDQGHDSNYGGAECGANIYGGTSFAAPMWAGYLALANQQAHANGGELIGFINPIIYPQAAQGGTTYSNLFHDITSGTAGSNWAVTGYDLVTGWGSPNGTGLIDALAGLQVGTPAVTLSPASLMWGKIVVGVTSGAKTVTLTNTGTAALDIGNIATSGDFAQKIVAKSCGSALAAGTSCVIEVTFTPTQIGVRTGTLTITDNASNSPQTVPLSGTGIPQATLTPTSKTFPAEMVGTSSPAVVFTLANKQSVTLSNIMISTTGDFSVSTTTCTTSLAAKSKCTISVVFTPTMTGTRTGTLKVSDSANNSPQTSSLTGTGK